MNIMVGNLWPVCLWLMCMGGLSVCVCVCMCVCVSAVLAWQLDKAGDSLDYQADTWLMHSHGHSQSL